MGIRTQQLTVAVAGADGSATGSGVTERPVHGVIRAIYIDYVTQPATCDVVVAETAAPAQTILSKADANTDAWFYPVANAHLNTSAAAITGEHVLIAVSDYLTVTVAQGNAGSVIVTIVYEE
jgi:hypothetical protein